MNSHERTIYRQAIGRLNESGSPIDDFVEWAARKAELAAVLEIQDDATGLAFGVMDPDGRRITTVATVWERVELRDQADVEKWQRGRWRMRDGAAWRLAMDNERQARRRLADVLNRWLVECEHGTAHEPTQQRQGRLPKAESAAKQTQLLALLVQHPTLVDDPAAAAAMAGISESTARRMIDKWRHQNRQRKDDRD